jgi:hypothetical protein
MKFKVEHLVLCKVATYRVVEANSMEEAMGKTAGIHTVTASGESNYEIVSDVEVLAVNIEKVE